MFLHEITCIYFLQRFLKTQTKLPMEDKSSSETFNTRAAGNKSSSRSTSS